MGSYYEDLKASYDLMKKIIKENPSGLDVDYIVYYITEHIPVSEKALHNRLKQMDKFNVIKITKGVAKWVK